MSKKITIIGSAGIPAKYGGFETLTEYLTQHLSNKLDITVYCSGKMYRRREKRHNNAQLKYIPLHANGAQSIPYDIISIIWSLFIADTLLILGVSGCIILPVIRLFSKKRIVVNIDGLEWKRDKWNSYIKKYLKFSEKLAVIYADEVVADNADIQRYVLGEYKRNASLIPYGGDHTTKEELSEETVARFPFLDTIYAFKVCRIEPENNIEMILKGFSEANTLPLVIIGNWHNSSFGKALRAKYGQLSHIHLLDPIYDQRLLNQIRSSCTLYVHGHSAGGTNPSLVEAMSLSLPIIAYGVGYNRETTENDALYFNSETDLSDLLRYINRQNLEALGKRMKEISDRRYTWETISEQYMAIM